MDGLDTIEWRALDVTPARVVVDVDVDVDLHGIVSRWIGMFHSGILAKAHSRRDATAARARGEANRRPRPSAPLSANK